MNIILVKDEDFVFDPKQEFYLIRLKEKKSFFSHFFKTDTDVREKQIVTRPPQIGCRAFVSDLVVGDEYVEHHISEIYKIDALSDYVGSGKYTDCQTAFPNAASGTFDGIGLDAGTRIIIYSEPNFKGKILLDIVGPAIINNVVWKNDDRYNIYMKKKFKEPYEKMFPPKVRYWSKTNMHDWTNGSIIVTCN